MREEKSKVGNATSLRDALKYTVKTKHPKTVAELAQFVEAAAAVDEDVFVYELKALVREGVIELQEPSYVLKSIADYLFTFPGSGWFWATIGLAFVAVLSVVFIHDSFPIDLIRWLLGSLFVLYLPGNMLIHFLFPRKESLSCLERFLLSVGLSLAVIPLVGLILNYLPWGIRFAPITISLTIFVVLFAFFALTRRYRNLRAESAR